MGHQADLIDVCVNLNLISADECQMLISLLSGEEVQRRMYQFQCEHGECDIGDCDVHREVALTKDLTQEYGLYEIQGNFLHFRFVDQYSDFLGGGAGGIELTKFLKKLTERGALNYEHLVSFNSTGGGWYDVNAAREEEARRKEPHESQFFGWNDYEAQAEEIPTMVLQAVVERRLKEG